MENRKSFIVKQYPVVQYNEKGKMVESEEYITQIIKLRKRFPIYPQELSEFSQFVKDAIVSEKKIGFWATENYKIEKCVKKGFDSKTGNEIELSDSYFMLFRSNQKLPMKLSEMIELEEILVNFLEKSQKLESNKKEEGKIKLTKKKKE